MSTYIKHKLNDQSGMTILMALFAFLVAAMVAAVILAAAMSSMRQAKDNQQHQQDMLILQSAGELIEREVCDKTKIYSVTETKFDKYDNQVGEPETTTTIESGRLFAPQIRDAYNKLYLASEQAAVDYLDESSTITVTVADDKFTQDVNVTYRFKKVDEHSALVVFTLKTSNPSSSIKHSLIASFKLSISSEELPVKDLAGGGKIKSTKQTLSWQVPEYSRVGGDE